ncbi:hypothetical protein AUJ10_02300 [Candidatus Pacearchaeota archaeon CG1_02_31_27]|nr:MAG: hypothetical protein AUJ10_02300 [Candidatus Pacearchaeota archaeon CG1_02_31_27]PIN92518.1 MAG: hypothetical protein COU55_01805 [Candidatus Pacearchaeota archaeon CG10_big_fil_rev_8_21_14_0_10_31_59]PIZ80833.1 MAG: hypothetical protein COX99_01625 [Candidatus Pacearchaeota archaeon CG_4_10_14_0_2_um_filter_31_10]
MRLSGEYRDKGEYHKNLDKNWPYYPVYLEKMAFVKKILRDLDRKSKILDAGCGEGILVEELKKEGFDIIGLDYNYSSKYVKKGSIFDMPFKDETFDVILCLDVIEHLNFEEQEKTLKEINRVAKKNALIILSIPNLAHLASRISFLFLGKLLRTSDIKRHKGDRPFAEYKNIIKKYFKIKKIRGLFPTCPIISILTLKIPSKVVWLHKIYNSILAIPSISFQNIYICRK